MANHLKGEVEVQAGGKKLIFRLGVNEMIAIQDALGFSDDDEKLWEALNNLKSVKVVRTIAHKGFLRDQPEMTELEAGDIVSEVGLVQITAVVIKALQWALPEKKEEAGPAEAEERPSDGPSSS